MAQIEQVGSGSINYTSDGKKLTKKIYVLTDGTTSVMLPSNIGAVVSADFQKQEAGTTRVEVTFQSGGSSGGSAAVPSSGAVEELIGGSREVPVKTHEYFKDLTREELAEVDRAFNEQDPAQQALRSSAFSSPQAEAEAEVLLGLLQKGVEYYLVPSLNFRETLVQRSKPTLEKMCSINSPANGPSINRGWNWLLTGINYQTVQSPTSGINYVVTREWTLSGRGGWQANNTSDFKLYGYG